MKSLLTILALLLAAGLRAQPAARSLSPACLLYTSDAADDSGTEYITVVAG